MSRVPAAPSTSAQSRPPRMAGHLHSPGAVRLAVHLQRPVCLLIRSPEDAVRSMHVREPQRPVGLLLRAYATFYEQLWPLRDRMVVAPFHEVVSDFARTIERLNARFDTRFEPFVPTEQALAQVRAKLEARNGPRGVRFSYLPDPTRDALKSALRLEGATLRRELARCERIHRQFVHGVG